MHRKIAIGLGLATLLSASPGFAQVKECTSKTACDGGVLIGSSAPGWWVEDLNGLTLLTDSNPNAGLEELTKPVRGDADVLKFRDDVHALAATQPMAAALLGSGAKMFDLFYGGHAFSEVTGLGVEYTVTIPIDPNDQTTELKAEATDGMFSSPESIHIPARTYLRAGKSNLAYAGEAGIQIPERTYPYIVSSGTAQIQIPERTYPYLTQGIHIPARTYAKLVETRDTDTGIVIDFPSTGFSIALGEGEFEANLDAKTVATGHLPSSDRTTPALIAPVELEKGFTMEIHSDGVVLFDESGSKIYDDRTSTGGLPLATLEGESGKLSFGENVQVDNVYIEETSFTTDGVDVDFPNLNFLNVVESMSFQAVWSRKTGDG